MVQRSGSRWFARLHDDLAWDILTLDCMLATVLALTVAVVASLSADFAEDLVAFEQWIWAICAVLGVVAVACLVCICASDRPRPASSSFASAANDRRKVGDIA